MNEVKGYWSNSSIATEGHNSRTTQLHQIRIMNEPRDRTCPRMVSKVGDLQG